MLPSGKPSSQLHSKLVYLSNSEKGRLHSTLFCNIANNKCRSHLQSNRAETENALSSVCELGAAERGTIFV